MPQISVTDTRAADGKISIEVSEVPREVTRVELDNLSRWIARQLRSELEATAIPATISESTLRAAVSRNVITAAVARQLASLEDELAHPGPTIAERG